MRRKDVQRLALELVGAIDALRTEMAMQDATIQRQAAEIERLQAIVTTVDDLHSPRLAHDTCLACDHNWPCPTHLLIHPEEARRG